ncbi:MAG: valine--tRNA ligase [Parvularculales bacterium]
MLEKTYNFSEVEPRLYEVWETSGAFRCGVPEKFQSGAEPYCIVIPPPNVTGALHMGHALNNTLQDILVRFERMRGRDVLWQPGMDHAGIATQMVVERQLAAEGNVSRRELGREAFVDRIWRWKEESGGLIVRQLRRLGVSCDWSRERFTLDEGLSKAVAKVFVQLYREGLIYKDKRLVNWDVELGTAISDLEVVSRETDGHLWYVRYPLEGREGEFITIATTRPETMLGDTGIVVHPDDERYQGLIGGYAVLPLAGRRLPIIDDTHADPEQGSGAVKITPAHDFNDFEVGQRHNFECLSIFDEKACVNENAPEAYQGMDRYEVRKKIVQDLEAAGLLDRIEPHRHMVPYGDRSNSVIEPYLTEQWYVNAGRLAVPAMEAVKQGDTIFVPRTWEKTYFDWLENIQPWCISRQLWWGHQIPAWYGPDMHIFVAHDEVEATEHATEHYGKAVTLTRDEDVLDTWFSSALWPFSTLGWPDETPELRRYYKTDVLVTAFDIIFFWVSRMMMMGLHFMKEVPFHTVYIHSLVRDENGQKMSKSRGNTMDPLEFMDKYGADALRFTLTAMAAQGREIKLSEARVAGYRNFCTKLWNAARFCEMNECVVEHDFDPADSTLQVNRWIAGETERTVQTVTQSLEAYRFNEAAATLYYFIWHVFCDWYLEFIKPLLNESSQQERDETRAMAAWVLEKILVVLHPMMPFITEELYQRLVAEVTGNKEMLINAPWPQFNKTLQDEAADAGMSFVIELVAQVRSVRSEMNVPAGARLNLIIKEAGADIKNRIERHKGIIERLAHLGGIHIGGGAQALSGSAQIVLGDALFLLPLGETIDVEVELKRLDKKIQKAQGDLERIEKRLGNEKFVEQAPASVIEDNKEKKEAAALVLAKLLGARQRMSE